MATTTDERIKEIEVKVAVASEPFAVGCEMTLSDVLMLLDEVHRLRAALTRMADVRNYLGISWFNCGSDENTFNTILTSHYADKVLRGEL